MAGEEAFGEKMGDFFGAHEPIVMPPSREDFDRLHVGELHCGHTYDQHGHGPYSSNCRRIIDASQLEAWRTLSVGQSMDLGDGADNPGECTCVIFYLCDASTGWVHQIDPTRGTRGQFRKV